MDRRSFMFGSAATLASAAVPAVPRPSMLFGGVSMLFDGGSDYLIDELRVGGDFYLGSCDFTIEFWVKRGAEGWEHHVRQGDKEGWNITITKVEA